MSKDVTYINEEIRNLEVRCVGEDGEVFGVMSRDEALKLADREPNANPPVCKIMNYSKFRYQQEKKLKETKKKQKIIEVKEIKLSAKIAQNDINYKVKHAKEFLSEGKHVRFRVFLKGREMNTPEIGVALLEKIWESDFRQIADRDKVPFLEGRYVNMLVTPKKS